MTTVIMKLEWDQLCMTFIKTAVGTYDMIIDEKSEQSRTNCPPIHRFSVFDVHTCVYECTLDKLGGSVF